MMMFYFGLIIALIAVVGNAVTIWLRRRRDYKKYIEPELAKAGYALLAIRTPSLFSTGPFSKFEIKFGVAHSSILGTRGEYNVYRIVEAVDSQGQPVTIWFKLYFELFSLKTIEWKIHPVL